MRRGASVVGLIKKNMFIILVILVLVSAIAYPLPGMKANERGLVTPLTFIAMFVSGLGLSFDKIKGSFKDYKSILYSFASVYILFPAVIFVIFSIFGTTEGDLYVGSMILASQSNTLSSGVVLTMSAGGNVPLALIITIINNVSSSFVSPPLLRLLLSAGGGISFDIGEMVVKLVTVLILPVLLAQVLRFFIKKYVNKIEPLCKMISKFTVLAFVFTGAASASSQLISNLATAGLIILFVSIIHIIMIAASVLYARIVKLDKDNRIAVMFCSSQKTLPASLLVWSTFFPGYALAPIVIVGYHVMQLLIDSVIITRLRKD
jgi:sodium/bile acid cotransporter 7